MFKCNSNLKFCQRMYYNDDNIWLDSVIYKKNSAPKRRLTHLSLASLLWDIGKQNSPRCDAAERGVPSGAILFAWMNFIEK